MTTIQITECDSCGGTTPDPVVLPHFIISGRTNASIRIDVCKDCYADSTMEVIVERAKNRGVFH